MAGRHGGSKCVGLNMAALEPPFVLMRGKKTGSTAGVNMSKHVHFDVQLFVALPPHPRSKCVGLNMAALQPPFVLMRSKKTGSTAGLNMLCCPNKTNKAWLPQDSKT